MLLGTSALMGNLSRLRPRSGFQALLTQEHLPPPPGMLSTGKIFQGKEMLIPEQLLGRKKILEEAPPSSSPCQRSCRMRLPCQSSKRLPRWNRWLSSWIPPLLWFDICEPSALKGCLSFSKLKNDANSSATFRPSFLPTLAYDPLHRGHFAEEHTILMIEHLLIPKRGHQRFSSLHLFLDCRPWLNHLGCLKMPDKRIPKMEFLTDKDWAAATREADLKTDDGVRQAMPNERTHSRRGPWRPAWNRTAIAASSVVAWLEFIR